MHYLGGIALEKLSLGREADLGLGAQEKLHSEFLFQFCDILADRRLGDSQFAGRCRKAAALDHGKEYF